MELYKITQVTGMRKKRDAIKSKVDRAIDRVENLEKAVGECLRQQERSSQADSEVGSRKKADRKCCISRRSMCDSIPLCVFSCIYFLFILY